MIIKKLENPGRVLPKEKARVIKSGYVILKKGEEIGEHITDKREELIVLFQGEAKIVCEGRESIVEAPSAIYIEPEKKHNVINAGDMDLKYVYTVAFI